MKIQIPGKKQFVTSRYVAMTPLNLYLEELLSISEGVRSLNESLDYVPAQLGGIQGQLGVLIDKAVIQLTDFKNNE